MMCWQHGYLLNQVLLTKWLIIAEDLSRYSFLVLTCTFVPDLSSGERVVNISTGNSTISNQLLAGSIIVRHMKSMTVPSLPFRVYGPIRSMHSVSHGVVTTIFVGSFPYLVCRLLLAWQDLQFLTWLQFLWSLQDGYFQDVADSGGTNSLLYAGDFLG